MHEMWAIAHSHGNHYSIHHAATGQDGRYPRRSGPLFPGDPLRATVRYPGPSAANMATPYGSAIPAGVPGNFYVAPQPAISARQGPLSLPVIFSPSTGLAHITLPESFGNHLASAYSFPAGLPPWKSANWSRIRELGPSATSTPERGVMFLSLIHI